MIGRFVRQVGLFSLTRTRIPTTDRSIPTRWASDDKKFEAFIDSFTLCKNKHPLSSEVFVFAHNTKDEFKKLSIDDNWQDIFKQGQICVEIIHTNCNKLLANRSKFLLDWVEEMANSSDPSYTADTILPKELSTGGPHGIGPLMQNVEDWWRLVDELSNQSKSDERTQIAIQNISLIANKLVHEIYNHKKFAPPNNRR